MMYNQRDDREMGGQTLEAERSDPRLAGGGRAGEFSWMKADASPAPVAPPQRKPGQSAAPGRVVHNIPAPNKSQAGITMPA